MNVIKYKPFLKVGCVKKGLERSHLYYSFTVFGSNIKMNNLLQLKIEG